MAHDTNSSSSILWFMESDDAFKIAPANTANTRLSSRASRCITALVRLTHDGLAALVFPLELTLIFRCVALRVVRSVLFMCFSFVLMPVTAGGGGAGGVGLFGGRRRFRVGGSGGQSFLNYPQGFLVERVRSCLGGIGVALDQALDQALHRKLGVDLDVVRGRLLVRRVGELPEQGLEEFDLHVPRPT